MKKLFTILLITINTISIYGQKRQLVFNLKVGETYYYTMQSSNIIKQVIDGQNNDIDIALTCKTAFKITNKKDTVYDMAVSYEQLGMTIKMLGKTIQFDSEKNDEKDILSSLFGALKGKQFLMKMSTKGKIIEVKNIDTIFEDLFVQFPKFPAEQKQQILSQLKQSYGEKAFKGSFEMITNLYTNTAVKKGDSWKIKTNLEAGMGGTLITNYEFKDKTKDYVLIIGNGKIKTLDKDAYVPTNGMPTRYDLDGTMNSNYKIDNKTGWILEAKITQSIKGTAEIKDNPNMPGGLTIPMTIDHNMSFDSK